MTEKVDQIPDSTIHSPIEEYFFGRDLSILKDHDLISERQHSINHAARTQQLCAKNEFLGDTFKILAYKRNPDLHKGWPSELLEPMSYFHEVLNDIINICILSKGGHFIL